MTPRVRLDAELVRRGLASSRSEAQHAIVKGLVAVKGLPARRASTQVDRDTPIKLSRPARTYVSRGGDKLDAALTRWDIPVAGRRWLDAGASTGGFSDRLLRGGAAAVVAVDVGYGQLAWSLRKDERMIVMERTNVRELARADLPWRPEGIVADLSFISLATVLPALESLAVPDADFILLVKPQFEAGRSAVGRSGVVRDPAAWSGSIDKVRAAGRRLGLALQDAAPSPLPGPAGNREFFVHLRRGPRDRPGAIERAVAEAAR